MAGMQAYIVRNAESKDIVGIYCAGSIRALAALVDDVISPSYCTYAAIGEGGITWPGRAIDDGWKLAIHENMRTFALHRDWKKLFWYRFKPEHWERL